MPVDLAHESFEPPPPEATLWRYIDLSKYLAMLTTNTIWFSRADLLGDPFEGSTTTRTLELRRARWNSVFREFPDSEFSPDERESDVERMLDSEAESNKRSMLWTFVSCWHENAHESAAMWRLYRHGYGVAVRSDLSRMGDAIAGEVLVHIGRVNYVDFVEGIIPEGNAFNALLRKRMSFQHEHEVRAMAQQMPIRNKEGGGILLDLAAVPPGLAIPADMAKLIESVRIDPDAPSWLEHVVRETTSALGFSFQVRQSELVGDPIY